MLDVPFSLASLRADFRVSGSLGRACLPCMLQTAHVVHKADDLHAAASSSPPPEVFRRKTANRLLPQSAREAAGCFKTIACLINQFHLFGKDNSTLLLQRHTVRPTWRDKIISLSQFSIQMRCSSDSPDCSSIQARQLLRLRSVLIKSFLAGFPWLQIVFFEVFRLWTSAYKSRSKSERFTHYWCLLSTESQ